MIGTGPFLLYVQCYRNFLLHSLDSKPGFKLRAGINICSKCRMKDTYLFCRAPGGKQGGAGASLPGAGWLHIRGGSALSRTECQEEEVEGRYRPTLSNVSLPDHRDGLSMYDLCRITWVGTRVADLVHFRPAPDPANKNFENRIRILLALIKNQFKHLNFFHIKNISSDIWMIIIFIWKNGKIHLKMYKSSLFKILFPCLYNSPLPKHR